ncbi:hypothetical protein LLG95_14130 [bacterium]|nr:hypothetical protein [bacterium]
MMSDMQDKVNIPARPRGYRIRRYAKIVFLTTLLVGLVFVSFLAGCQRRFIYFPRPYDARELGVMAPKAVVIQYRTSAGIQKAYYIKPAESPDAPPDRLWLMIVGNASRALEWIEFTANPPDPRAGFYLFDYPGYGYNEGRPSRASINEASLAAVDALAAHLKMTRAELCPRMRLMAHSLGTGVSLDLAVRLDPPPRQIILMSPYTSLYAMARLTFGWPLCHLLIDRFDNEKRLAELAARTPRPEVTIIHGDRDQIIPVEMGRALAAAHPGWIQYHELRFVDHNWIVGSARPIWSRIIASEAKPAFTGAK